jgi:hypothetical protein
LQNVRTGRGPCYEGPTHAMRTSAIALALSLLAACSKDDREGDRPPPPPPPPTASARADLCADGGGQDTDSISATLVPRAVAGYCLDPQTEVKTYGDKGQLTMDDVCTTAFDGECEVYKRLGLDRVVVVRYVDGSGAPNSVEVNLSRFKTPDGAYAMFTGRVVADGDPAKATVKPLAAGAAGATSSSNAYVWRGQYLAELTFVTEDTKMTPQAMAAANEQETGAIAKDIGSKLPGTTDLLPAAAALPAEKRLPIGIAYHPRDALGLSSVGPLAVGYYQDGDKRWRDVAIVRATADDAKEAFRAFKLRPGALPVKGLGDEAVQVVLQEASDRPKAEYVVARKGMMVAAVGDEELVLTVGTPSDRLAPLRLTKDEKATKLGAWLSK